MFLLVNIVKVCALIICVNLTIYQDGNENIR